jgi:hypothetical protein
MSAGLIGAAVTFGQKVDWQLTVIFYSRVYSDLAWLIVQIVKEEIGVVLPVVTDREHGRIPKEEWRNQHCSSQPHHSRRRDTVTFGTGISQMAVTPSP